ncbi:precorrin-6y C5,15-methyltransferase (decarboxylating) subunit CbiE [Cereibacter sphaeroides]|uniref:precorrin-6y C5,15-methyltransferase (decarboxylating) subunit CbiE n=1 Tax=Cereibacter sphaeroides TaxID=1063 RepID=UPI001F3F7D99|nr:precorrin-6y C5,15-methyltransferase (decarboxylating) subunit CbiE [Cereibacter sphaeroides]MCE6962115.1 precorrin-6y C5,15-methyltransferase (decarboxylating) subunit CbiE [Cereibacter sphaeroides]MCE6971986.1 precorrin-6y C5,15-methyltransferase (decarboxylating) subunit CbiE [Cereibacter sphaeroides]
MADPWLSIIGLGEDGPAGLTDASRAALAAAEVVVGAPRHLALVAAGERGMEWPVPFDLAPVLALRDRRVAVLASGDPFWHGAGGSLAAVLGPGEWRAFPAPGVISLAAARLGWRLEEVRCLGLHAAPFERLVPDLAQGFRAICTLRDAAAAADLARWLSAAGWGASRLWILEALGGPRERVRQTTAEDFSLEGIEAPVAVALEAAGAIALPRVPGLPEARFAHDGQITKAAVRAVTLAALAPRSGELLWDLGAGSGSVSVEWCLAGGRAVAVELRPGRAANIRENAGRFGLTDRLTVVEGPARDVLPDLPVPDAIFVGGGFDADLFAALPRAARLVVNAVTLETEALLAELHARHGGELLRIDLARAAPLGRMRGWESARPVVQWSLAP